MRTGEYRRSHLVWLSKLALLLALGLPGLGIAQKGFEEKWDEKASGGSKGKGAPPPAPKPAPAPAPAPPVPIPPPLPPPPPDPKDAKFKTANEYACAKVDGKGGIPDPVTKETAADKARREWESKRTNRKSSATGSSPKGDVPAFTKTPLPANATPYMKMCDAAGVPLPPRWGSDEWVQQGTLDPAKTFASDAPVTEVWTYKTPDGICYALPRIRGGVIELLGQICQGNNGKACFWDNIDGKTPEVEVTNPRPPPAKMKVPNRVPVTDNSGPLNMAGADTMVVAKGEQCTACHRGENVFLIHPGTALERESTDPCKPGGAKPTDSAKPSYEPIAPNFTNPKNEPLQPPLTNDACTNCHSIPSLTPGWCGTVFRQAVDGAPAQPPPAGRTKVAQKKTMPPPDGTRSPDEQASVDEIKARCAALKP